MLPYLNHIADDQDVTVRNVAVQILLDLCQMVDSQKCQDFLDIIEKVIRTPSNSLTPSCAEVGSVKCEKPKQRMILNTRVSGSNMTS